MEVILNWAARAACSLIFTLPMRTRPSYSAANSSNRGPSILQGPHHSAQKSTRIGPADSTTSLVKFSGVKVTILGAAIISESFADACLPYLSN